MNAVNVGLGTFIIQHNRIQGVFLLCKITNLLIYSLIVTSYNLLIFLYPHSYFQYLYLINNVMDFSAFYIVTLIVALSRKNRHCL